MLKVKTASMNRNAKILRGWCAINKQLALRYICGEDKNEQMKFALGLNFDDLTEEQVDVMYAALQRHWDDIGPNREKQMKETGATNIPPDWWDAPTNPLRSIQPKKRG